MSVVWFRSVPLRTFLDLLISVDALQREVQIIGLDDDRSPQREAAAAAAGRVAFDEARSTLFDQAIEAYEAGAVATDLAASYDPDVWESILVVAEAVLGADEAAAAGGLLTLPLPATQRALYGWMSEEVRRQVAGAAPRTYGSDPPSPG